MEATMVCLKENLPLQLLSSILNLAEVCGVNLPVKKHGSGKSEFSSLRAKV
jgi:hypothetical protein